MSAIDPTTRILMIATSAHFSTSTQWNELAVQCRKRTYQQFEEITTVVKRTTLLQTNAIMRIGRELRAAMNEDWLAHATLVPAPPSKIASDPEYDPRMRRVCRAINSALDIRELVVANATRPPFHGGNRMTVDQLMRHLEINEAQTLPPPQQILIVDDVLVSGTHFKAMMQMLAHRYPDVPVYGVFVARRVFANPFEAVDL